MSHDHLRSTTQRLGSTSKRFGWILFTTSAEMWCARHLATKVFLKPPSQKTFFNRPERPRARWRTSMPPANAAGVDDACRGLRVSSLLYPHELDKTPTDGLPRPVLGPGDVVAVHGVPLRVARRQCPPLTA